MTMYMAWIKKGGKKAICQIPVLTAEEKAELKARIAEALRLRLSVNNIELVF